MMNDKYLTIAVHWTINFWHIFHMQNATKKMQRDGP